MALFKDVNVVTYHVKDWVAAKNFYREILAWRVCYEDENLGWMEFGEDGKTHISISRVVPDSGSTTPENGPIAVLSVENAVAATAELRARGVRCDDAVDIPGVVCFGTFYDPEGNKLQFASPPAE
jgi:predicted enzyme related to lactoylglutathione lyase